MATTTPYGNPNWLKRQMRLNTPQSPEETATNDPRAMATGMFNAGMQLDQRGGVRPTRDFGSLLRLNSSQMNPLSRGVKPGSFSSLGQPMNSMYANNPGFFNRDSGASFAEKIQQRNQTMSQERPVDTALLDRRGFDQGNRPPAPTPSQNRAKLEDRASGLKLLREMSGPKVTEVGGGKNIEGKYGTGWSAPTMPGKKNEGMIDGKPASEVLQGLANKPGLARPGDKYQPKKWTAEELRKLRK